MLAGGGRDDVVGRLAEVLGRRVVLVAADGAVRVDRSPAGHRPRPAATDAVPGYADPDRFAEPRRAVLEPSTLERVATATAPADIETFDGFRARAVPVTAAPGRYWLLLAELPADARVDALLGAAVNALRIEAVRRDARADAIAASASWLIDELRFGSLRSSAEMTRLALRLGVRVDAPHAAAALRYTGRDLEMWATATSWIDAPVQVRGASAWSVLDGDVRARATQISERLVQFARGEVLVAVGSTVTGAEATRASFDEAERVLALVLHRRAAGLELGPVTTLHELGASGLLLSTPRPALEAYVATHLGPLLDRPDLLHTLVAWCESGGRRQETARAVTLHRNSIAYRLARIGELLEVDLYEPEALFRLRTALAAHELLAALA